MMYLHKAPHREWLPALRHLSAYTQRTFPEPATLFDTYEGRGKAAKQAEMNILKDMNWAGDSKLYPEVVKSLGLDKTDPNPGGFAREVGRMNPQQRADCPYSGGRPNISAMQPTTIITSTPVSMP
jgi:hypothetical protein